MSRSLVFIVLIFSIFFNKTQVAAAENLHLRIVLVNDRDGNEIKSSYDLKVFLEPGGQELKLTTDKKKNSFYEVPEGKNIKVKVTAVGFYADERVFDTQNMSDGDLVEVRMNPKPSGSLIVTTIDGETKDPVISDVEIVFFSRINKEKINETNPQINYFYEQKGKYKLTTVAKGYLNDVREVDLDISADQKTTNLVIELVKNRMKQAIEFTDKSTNLKITTGTASIKHKETGQNIYEGKIINGGIEFDANRNNNYILTVKSNGFTDLVENFVLDGKPKKYGLTPNSSLMIDIFDDETNARIGCELELISPTGKKTKLIASDKNSIAFVPDEMGTYTIESKAKGYINRTGTFNVKSMTVGSLFYTLRLKKGSNEFIINVFDSETKEPLNNAVVKVFNEQSKEISGKPTKNQKTVNLDVEKKHFFEVSAPGYFDYTANVAFDKSIQVYLKKKEEETLVEMVFKVVDEQTKMPIKDARLRVFENNERAIPLVFDANSGEYKAGKINLKNVYNFEASAKGYNNLRENINKGELKNDISLTPFELKPYYFTFFDAFTDQKIDADFKLKVDSKEINTEPENGKLKGMLSNVSNYAVEVKKEGYKSLSKLIDKRESDASEFKLKIFKEFYPIQFKIANKLTDLHANEAMAKITTKQSNKSEELKLDLTEKAFLGNISPESNYFIEVSVPDFEPFTFAFMLKQANPASLDYTFNLKSKPKPVEKKVEPEKPKPATIEKTETPKIEQKVEAKTEPKIEKKSEVVATPLDIKRGVKYPLEGVNFSKSQTTLVPGAEAKLDALVAYMKANPKNNIEIAGHTDNEGADQRLNQRLSEFRAKVVANYLFNKGISPSRIETVGKGSSEPLVPNDSDENKAKNRRIEILVLED